MVKTSSNSMTEQPSSSPSSSYKGVRKRKWGKWVSEIRLPNSRERIWLGSYDSPEKAARAFDAALFCLRGPGAKFNFPDNPPDINITGAGGRPVSAQEIQVLAARYANEETPSNESWAATSRHTSSPSDGVVQVDTESDHATIDWSFWSTLDTNEQAVASDFGLFPELDMSMNMNMNMNMNSDELYPPPPPTPTPPMIDDNGEDHQNVYSQSSFLWNF